MPKGLVVGKLEVACCAEGASASAPPRQRTAKRRLTRNQLVLQNSAIGKLNLASLISDNDDGSPQNDLAAEGNVSRDGQVIELDHLGDRLEALLEIGHLLEVVAELLGAKRAVG